MIKLFNTNTKKWESPDSNPVWCFPPNIIRGPPANDPSLHTDLPYLQALIPRTL